MNIPNHQMFDSRNVGSTGFDVRNRHASRCADEKYAASTREVLQSERESAEDFRVDPVSTAAAAEPSLRSARAAQWKGRRQR